MLLLMVTTDSIFKITEHRNSCIDYNSDLILTNEENSLSKKEIIESAKNKNIFPPRTSRYVINFKNLVFQFYYLT